MSKITSVTIDSDFINKKFKEFYKKMEERPYRDKRFKKGFRMELFNLETGQFQQGRYITYWKKI